MRKYTILLIEPQGDFAVTAIFVEELTFEELGHFWKIFLAPQEAHLVEE